MAWLLVVLALIAVVGMAILAIGSRQRLPEPFGLARNGAIVYDSDGDIYLADPASREAHAIIAGPDFDFSPAFSLQGNRLAFLRKVDAADLGNGGDVNLMVADADGRHEVQVAGPMRYENRFGDSIQWSPDGSVIAIGFAASGVPQIVLAAADGSGARVLDVGMPAHSPSWRPMNGAQLLFWAKSRQEGPGLYLVQDDGQGLRRLDIHSENEFAADYDFLETSWSPDGTRLVYRAAHLGTTPDDAGWRPLIHIAEISPTGNVSSDTKVQFDSRSEGESLPRWSPDGQRILFQVHEGDNTSLAFAPANGPGPATRIASTASQGFTFEWAPDSSAVLSMDKATGATQILYTDVLSLGAAKLGTYQSPNWQRLAR